MTANNDDALEIGVSESGSVPVTPIAAPVLTVSFPPHSRTVETVQRIMLVTCAALLPAAGFSVALYGISALASIAGAVIAAAATEWLIVALRDRSLPSFDGSSCLTGLLLALSLPPSLPFWAAPLAAVFAIAVVKMAFGGLGRNFLNPALAGRAFCAFTFPAFFMTAAAGSARIAGGPGSSDTVVNLFVGYAGGWLGSSSVAALLLGAGALWILRIIDGAVPLSFLGCTFLLSWATSGTGQLFTASALLAALTMVLTGGIPLVSLFMATDPVTSPGTRRSRLLFGAGCGALAVAFRKFGNANDGAMQAVLLMNLTVPFFDRCFKQVPFGGRHRFVARAPAGQPFETIPEHVARHEPDEEESMTPAEEL